MVYFIYILINVCLLLAFVATGYVIAKCPKGNFWKLYSPAMICYTLILGLRYDRGADYIHYQEVYRMDLDTDKRLFTAFNDLLKYIGVDDIGVYFVYSFVFIFLAGFLIKEYRSLAKCLLPMFLAANIIFNEWFVSQGLGLSFVLLYCAFLFRENLTITEKTLLCGVTAACGCMFHSGNLFNIAVVTSLYLCYRRAFDWRLCVGLFLFASYYFQYHTDFTLVNKLLAFVYGLDPRMDEYIRQSDDWFSNAAVQDDYYRKGIFKVWQTIGECSFFYFANLAFRKRTKLVSDGQKMCLIVMFNTFVIGAIMGQMFFAVEILKRVASSVYLMWCFPLAYTVRTVRFKGLTPVNKLLYCSMLWFFYEYLKYMLYRVDHVYTFIWDKIE